MSENTPSVSAYLRKSRIEEPCPVMRLVFALLVGYDVSRAKQCGIVYGRLEYYI